jgi:fructose transport system permease protein
VSRSETIRGSDMPAIMTATGNNAFRVAGFSLTWGTIIMLLLFAFFFYALGNTAWGKHVYATGDDIEAARLSGIRTDRVLLSVYLVAGLIYAIGAWILMGRLASASPNVGTEYNLNSITAVVLGGTSLFGGRGKALHGVLGGLVIAGIDNGMGLLGFTAASQHIVTALVLLAAVTIDALSRRGRVAGL